MGLASFPAVPGFAQPGASTPGMPSPQSTAAGIQFSLGIPFLGWSADTSYLNWSAEIPDLRWATGNAYIQWQVP